jgi:hypothetical protein
MMRELLKIFGIPVSDSVNVSEINITFHGISAGTAVLVGLVLIAATYFIYFRTTPTLSPLQKGFLAFLRSLLIAMILLMLMRQHADQGPAPGPRRPQTRRHREGRYRSQGRP